VGDVLDTVKASVAMSNAGLTFAKLTKIVCGSKSKDIAAFSKFAEGFKKRALKTVPYMCFYAYSLFLHSSSFLSFSILFISFYLISFRSLTTGDSWTAAERHADPRAHSRGEYQLFQRLLG